MKNIDVVNAFLNHKDAVSYSKNLTSRNDKLFSYSTCIAEFYKYKLLVNDSKYSRSTSRHQLHLLRSISNEDNVVYIHGKYNDANLHHRL
jgi:hypothetical protein